MSTRLLNGRDGMGWDGMGWDLLIIVMSCIYKWDEKMFYFHLYIFFGTKIYYGLVSKEMKFCGISSQLEKLLFLISNEIGMWWNLSISLPSRIYKWDKKISYSRPLIFVWDKNFISISSQIRWDPAGSHSIRKNYHL